MGGSQDAGSCQQGYCASVKGHGDFSLDKKKKKTSRGPREYITYSVSRPFLEGASKGKNLHQKSLDPEDRFSN